MNKVSILMSQILTIQNVDLAPEDSRFPLIGSWELPYYSLLSISKVLESNPSIASLPTWNQEYWTIISKFLLYPHPSIQNCVTSLLSLHFEGVHSTNLHFKDSSSSKKSKSDPKLSFLLTNGNGASELAYRHLQLFKMEEFDKALGKGVVRNLLFLGACLSQNHQSKDIKAVLELELELELKGGGSDSSLGGENLVRSLGMDFKSRPRNLSWLLNQLSFISKLCLPKGPTTSQVRTNIFQLFAGLTTRLDSSCFQDKDISTMIESLYKVVHDDTYKGNYVDRHTKTLEEGTQSWKDSSQQSDPSLTGLSMESSLSMDVISNLKSLGMDVLACLEKKFTSERYLPIYQEVHTKVMSTRRERKTHKQILAVKDPKGFAQWKIGRNEVKKQGKKRRLDDRMTGKGLVRGEISKKIRRTQGLGEDVT